MKTVLLIHLSRYVRCKKSIDLQFVPTEGMLFEDHAWKQPRKVDSSWYSVNDEQLWVEIEAYDPNKNDWSALADVHAAHGWTVVKED